MSNTTMKPIRERKLRGNSSFRQAVRNSLTMAYRGLLKIKRFVR